MPELATTAIDEIPRSASSPLSLRRFASSLSARQKVDAKSGHSRVKSSARYDYGHHSGGSTYTVDGEESASNFEHRVTNNSDVLSSTQGIMERLHLAAEDICIQCVHPSVKGGQNTWFAITYLTSNTTRYFNCASARERDEWVASLKRTLMHGGERRRHVDNSLRIGVLELKGLQGVPASGNSNNSCRPPDSGATGGGLTRSTSRSSFYSASNIGLADSHHLTSKGCAPSGGTSSTAVSTSSCSECKSSNGSSGGLRRPRWRKQCRSRYYVEILVDDRLYARTGVKQPISSTANSSSCFWGEQFYFHNLPPATDKVVLNVYKEKLTSASGVACPTSYPAFDFDHDPTAVSCASPTSTITRDVLNAVLVSSVAASDSSPSNGCLPILHGPSTADDYSDAIWRRIVPTLAQTGDPDAVVERASLAGHMTGMRRKMRKEQHSGKTKAKTQRGGTTCKRKLIGRVRLGASSIRSRYVQEKWLPVDKVSRRESALSVRISFQMQSVDVLPIQDYQELLDYVTDEYALICRSFEPCISVKVKDELAQSLIAVFHIEGVAEEALAQIVVDEVANVENQHLSFRGNSIATKAMEAYIKKVGQKYLQTTLLPVINEIVHANEVDLEIDPVKIGLANGEARCCNHRSLSDLTSTVRNDRTKDYDLGRRQANLKTVIQQIWSRISASASYFPLSLKQCFNKIRHRLELIGRSEMADNLISACIFLRYICPAILSPSLFRLTDEFPSERANRNLTLIAKALQTLANFSRYGNGKETSMEFLNDFLSDHSELMRHFLKQISTIGPNEVHLLRSMPSRKAVPDLGSPSANLGDTSLDLARHLAILHSLLAENIGKVNYFAQHSAATNQSEVVLTRSPESVNSAHKAWTAKIQVLRVVLDRLNRKQDRPSLCELERISSSAYDDSVSQSSSVRPPSHMAHRVLNTLSRRTSGSPSRSVTPVDRPIGVHGRVHPYDDNSRPSGEAKGCSSGVVENSSRIGGFSWSWTLPKKSTATMQVSSAQLREDCSLMESNKAAACKSIVPTARAHRPALADCSSGNSALSNCNNVVVNNFVLLDNPVVANDDLCSTGSSVNSGIRAPSAPRPTRVKIVGGQSAVTSPMQTDLEGVGLPPQPSMRSRSGDASALRSNEWPQPPQHHSVFGSCLSLASDQRHHQSAVRKHRQRMGLINFAADSPINVVGLTPSNQPPSGRTRQGLCTPSRLLTRQMSSPIVSDQPNDCGGVDDDDGDNEDNCEDGEESEVTVDSSSPRPLSVDDHQHSAHHWHGSTKIASPYNFRPPANSAGQPLPDGLLVNRSPSTSSTSTTSESGCSSDDSTYSSQYHSSDAACSTNMRTSPPQIKSSQSSSFGRIGGTPGMHGCPTSKAVAIDQRSQPVGLFADSADLGQFGWVSNGVGLPQSDGSMDDGQAGKSKSLLEYENEIRSLRSAMDALQVKLVEAERRLHAEHKDDKQVACESTGSPSATETSDHFTSV